MNEYERAIDARDEFSHVPEGEDDWRENWWLVFFDHGSGVRGIVYGGVQPLRGNGFATFALFKDDRPLFLFDRHDLNRADYDHATGKLGPLAFLCREPHRRWAVSIDTGHARGSLEWEAVHSAYDWCWGMQTRSRHYEQPGRVSGHIVIGNESFMIEGWGQRDRAWGHRPLSVIQNAWSSRVFFGEDDYQHASLIKVGDRTNLFGYKIDHGRSTLIERLWLRPSYAYRGGPPLTTELRAWTGGELIADQQVRLTNVVPHFAVTDGVESNFFLTFSRFHGLKSSTVGQLDHLWTAPTLPEMEMDITGNNGVWVAS
jgi:hypothetical protein